MPNVERLRTTTNTLSCSASCTDWPDHLNSAPCAGGVSRGYGCLVVSRRKRELRMVRTFPRPSCPAFGRELIPT